MRIKDKGNGDLTIMLRRLYFFLRVINIIKGFYTHLRI